MKEKFFFKISINILTQVYNIVIFYFLALSLDNVVIGVIGYTHSLIGFVLMITSVGLELIYLQHNADQHFKQHFSIFFLLKTIKVLIAYIPLLIFVFFGYDDSETLGFMLLTILAYVITSFSNVFTLNLESRQKMIKTSLVLLLNQFVKNTMIIIIILNLKHISNPLYSISLVYVVSALFHLAITLIFSRKEFKFYKIDKKILKTYLKSFKPYILYFLMSGFINQFGKILLDLNYGHAELALFYVVEANIIAIFLIISTQISNLFYSYLPKEFENKNFETIKAITHTTEKYASIIFLSVILVVQMNSEKFFNILLPKYANAAIYLRILIFIPYFVGINQPYSSHLIPSKNEKIFSNYFVIKSAVWVLLILFIVPPNVLFIPALGFGGIGLSFMIVLGLFFDVFFYRYFSKRIGIPSNRNIVSHLIFAMISFIIVQILFNFILVNLVQNEIIYILLSSLAIIGLFFLQLILFKELNKQDKTFFVNLFKVRSYRESFLEEIKN